MIFLHQSSSLYISRFCRWIDDDSSHFSKVTPDKLCILPLKASCTTMYLQFGQQKIIAGSYIWLRNFFNVYSDEIKHLCSDFLTCLIIKCSGYNFHFNIFFDHDCFQHSCTWCIHLYSQIRCPIEAFEVIHNFTPNTIIARVCKTFGQFAFEDLTASLSWSNILRKTNST